MTGARPRRCGLRPAADARGPWSLCAISLAFFAAGLWTFSRTSYTGRCRDARYSSGVIHPPSLCKILPERSHRIQEFRAPMNSPEGGAHPDAGKRRHVPHASRNSSTFSLVFM